MATRISKKDWDNVTTFVLDELQARKASKMRRRHEAIWQEVDRQVYMESMSRSKRDKDATADWRSAIELGEISRASEIITADIRRMTFPKTRSWFDIHADIKPDLTEEGPKIDKRFLKRVDGRTRAFMTQQHIDFGYKSRMDLSGKEALHHGSYVATVEEETLIGVAAGSSVKTLTSPVWKPHSMWNCFPDSDSTILGNNMFFQGSMIIVSYKPLYQVRKMVSGDPKYPYFNLNRITQKTNKREQVDDTDDVELVTYYGDIVIPRASGKDILLLNSRAIIANNTIIHYQPNPFIYPPVIFNGWERLDVRDPYYVSPLVKFSVTQKIGSILANRFLDLVELNAEPPVEYDGNNPDYQLNGGPDISPGAKNANKGGLGWSTIDVGDPGPVLTGLQWVTQQIEAGTKVDRVRSGVAAGTEQTATEVVKQSQNAELSTVDFVDKHELQGLAPSLYMQHDLNKKNVKDYPFYNQEIDAPDFETMKRKELPENLNIDVVGSKGLLEEERRQSQTAQVTSFWMGANPQLVNQPEVAKEMYRDAGNKNPERFLNIGDEAEKFQQQLQSIVQQAQQQIAQLQQQIAEFAMQDEEHSLEIEQKELEKEQLQTKISTLNGILQIQTKLVQANKTMTAPDREQ